jgi:Flp pilus assembly protein TadD
MLFALEADRDALLEHARDAVSNSEFAESLQLLDRAAQLRRGDDVLRLRAVALFLSRDFAGALAAYHDCVKASGRA